MKFALFVFILLLLPLTTGLQFSPSKLEFDLEQNQISCKNIYFVLDAQASVSDIWAENQNIPWSVTQFETSSNVHQLSLSYPNQLAPDQTQLELCLSGTQNGEYHGALLFRQGEQGNSIVQFVVWLDVTISGENQLPAPQIQNKPNKKSHSSSSSGGGINEYNVVPQEKPKEEFQELKFDIPNEKIELGAATKKSVAQQSNIVPLLAIMITLIIFLFLLFLLLKRK